jgi:CRISPR/Cas system Type II protein with McrA/HNH and RuvC-like nuclease domain
VPTALGALVFGQTEAQGDQTRLAVRRRTRRRVRRRIRRRAVRRVVFGRPVWVVPVGLAVGWELAYENRIVVVKEIKVVEKDGMKVQVASVQDSTGKTEDVEILREDNADNRRDLEGSVLPDNDKTTPGVEGEVED